MIETKEIDGVMFTIGQLTEKRCSVCRNIFRPATWVRMTPKGRIERRTSDDRFIYQKPRLNIIVSSDGVISPPEYSSAECCSEECKSIGIAAIPGIIEEREKGIEVWKAGEGDRAKKLIETKARIEAEQEKIKKRRVRDQEIEEEQRGKTYFRQGETEIKNVKKVQSHSSGFRVTCFDGVVHSFPLGYSCFLTIDNIEKSENEFLERW